MSNSVKEMLAALLQTNNSEAVSDKPIVKASGFELIRLLNSKAVDPTAIVFRTNGEAILFEDDNPVTFGDLATVVPGGAVRKDGTKVNDYPVVWGLTQSECSAAIDYLKPLPDKPKASGNGFSPKARNAKKADKSEGLTEELLMSLLSKLIEGDKEPALPVPAQGHHKLASPAKPVPQSVTTRRVGDVISILDENGDHHQRQIVGEAGKFRLNKTIV